MIIWSFFLLFPFFSSLDSWGSGQRGYIRETFVQLLVVPQKQTSALRTLKCNERVEILEQLPANPSKEIFYKIKIDKDQGFVEQEYISKQKVECFTQKYPEFFQEMVKKGLIEKKDLYLWGELYNEWESTQIQIYP